MEIITTTVLWAITATCLVAAPGLPIAYLLARHQFPGHRILSTLLSLPMVLPPTAVGFLLLQLLADRGLLGREQLGIDLDILYTWKAVVLACSVMAAPLVIRTARVSFEEVDPELEQMARTLGYSRLKSFIRVTLPLAWKGLLAAVLLGFTRSLGEFGATVMIAGNIPGKTQTLASAIYSAQQSGKDERALLLVAVALLVGFVAIFLTEICLRPNTKSKGLTR
ncbi:molybdate ABC transporter permease subunit [Coraliomargarita algicola]|uniref:Molybdenum transport system permease n=1 Tax=Coraliomargarita algicola TaxID=3092156 RepID=A0ABZ0RQ94_9BACT|nr:molybdate ABC transporter permease subunit [Coraliomargarita sp. J2-16]WPJ97591.1 molybdate ABC transporter permease subunit [Coraliomargarita sp. J2-16]